MLSGRRFAIEGRHPAPLTTWVVPAGSQATAGAPVTGVRPPSVAGGGGGGGGGGGDTAGGGGLGGVGWDTPPPSGTGCRRATYNGKDGRMKASDWDDLFSNTAHVVDLHINTEALARNKSGKAQRKRGLSP